MFYVEQFARRASGIPYTKHRLGKAGSVDPLGLEINSGIARGQSFAVKLGQPGWTIYVEVMKSHSRKEGLALDCHLSKIGLFAKPIHPWKLTPDRL
jgi:hypothetical protein